MDFSLNFPTFSVSVRTLPGEMKDDSFTRVLFRLSDPGAQDFRILSGVPMTDDGAFPSATE